MSTDAPTLHCIRPNCCQLLDWRGEDGPCPDYERWSDERADLLHAETRGDLEVEEER